MPDSWKCPLNSDDMDEEVNCACCGKRIPFGDAYSSLKIFTDSGTWSHLVCINCYDQEIKEAKLYGSKKRD